MKVKIGKYPTDYADERKIKIQIDRWDTWSLDHTLALIIHPALVQFKNNNNGHPSDMTGEEWDQIIDKMISAFAEILDEDISFTEKGQEGLELFGKYFRHLWT